MKYSNRCAIAVALFALAGYQSDSLMALQSHYDNYPSYRQDNEGLDTIELIPYGQSGHSAMRQSYQPRSNYQSGPNLQSQRIPSSYGRGTMAGRMPYPGSFQGAPPYRRGNSSDSRYRAPYQGNPGLSHGPYDPDARNNYQMRRDDFTYANDPSVRYSHQHQGRERHRGEHSHGNHARRGFDSQETRQSAYYSAPDFRDEADQVPQLNMYGPRPDDRSSYQLSRPEQSFDGRSFQMRQGYAGSNQPGNVGSTSEEGVSPFGPPLGSLGGPANPGALGCGHAGCHHN